MGDKQPPKKRNIAAGFLKQTVDAAMQRAAAAGATSTTAEFSRAGAGKVLVPPHLHVDGSGTQHVHSRMVSAYARRGTVTEGVQREFMMPPNDMHLFGSHEETSYCCPEEPGHSYDTQSFASRLEDQLKDDDEVPFKESIHDSRVGGFVHGEGSSRATKYRKKQAEDGSWFVQGPIAGGPRDASHIPSIGGHVALRLWDGLDRRVLKCQNQKRVAVRLRKWLRNLRPEAQTCVRRSGLWSLPFCIGDAIDMPLISAFVERWQPDTNSFHLPFGEMTIMMHDVWHILRIPTEGRLYESSRSGLDLRQAVLSLLGVEMTQSLFMGFGVQTQAIVTACDTDPPRDEDIQIAAIFSLILGCCLFPDKGGSTMSLQDFVFVDQIDDLQGVSWGSATLAWLYRQLGIASRDATTGIAGCLTLLQCWIYEYFPMFRPHRERLPLDSNTPRALMWSIRVEPRDIERLVGIRTTLDCMTAQQVEWLPYGREPAELVPRTCYMGTVCYRGVIEPYMPVRCLRQLGRRQSIPVPPIVPEFHRRPSKPPTSYEVRHGVGAMKFSWSSFPHSACLNLQRYPRSRVSKPYRVNPDYYPWYMIHSRPCLVQSNSRQSGRIPPRTAVEEWANLWIGTISDLTKHRQQYQNPDFIRACNDADELVQRWHQALTPGLLQDGDNDDDDDHGDGDGDSDGDDDDDDADT